MTGQSIREAVTGATIEIDTPLGTKLPISFSPDGRITGEASGLAFYLGAERDTGKWWIDGDRLCQKWTRWFDAAPQCLELKQDGSRYLWRRDDGKTGTASITIKAQPAMVATATEAPQPERRSPIIAPMPRSLNKAPPTPQPRVTVAPAPAPAPASAAAEPSSVAMVATPFGAIPRRSPPAAQVETVVPPPAPVVAAPAAVRPAPFTVSRAAMAGPSYKVSGVAQFDVLYVRGGPSSEHAALGSIPPYGRGIRIVGQCRQDWCPVRHRDLDGWVNRYYLTQEFATQRADRQQVKDFRQQESQ